MKKKELLEILESKWKGTKESLGKFLEDKKYYVGKVLAGAMSVVVLLSMLTACQPIENQENDKGDESSISEEQTTNEKDKNMPTFFVGMLEDIQSKDKNVPDNVIEPDNIESEEISKEEEIIVDDEEVIVDDEEVIVDEEDEIVVEEDEYDGVELLTRGKNTLNDKFEDDKICINGSDFQLSERLLKKFYDTIEDYDYKVGFYITDPNTNMTISYNADENFSTASTVKAGMALYAMKVIDSGKYDLDDTMVFEKKHVYSGGTRQAIYPMGVGTELTLKDVIYYTINDSDNEGYMMLMDKFGIEGYNEMVSGLGCNTWVGKKGLKFGYFTPQELNLIWQEIYAYTESDSENAKWFKDLFINAKFNFTKEHMPEEYEDIDIAHKSGFSKLAFNDSSIMYFEDGPAIMTIMTSQGNSNRRPFRKFIPLFVDAWEEYMEYLKTINVQEIENER